MSQENQRVDFTPEETEMLGRLRLGSHPSPDLLRAAGEEALPEDIRQEIHDHLRDCELCSILQRDLSQLEPGDPGEEQRRRIRGEVTTNGRRLEKTWSRRPWRLVLAAGALAIVIGFGGFLMTRSGRVSAPREAPGPTLAISHVPQFAIEKAPIEIPAELLPTRGARKTDLPSLQEWSLALKPYQEGDFDRAVTKLAAITTKYPHFADGYFYLGVSQLMMRRDADAAGSLKTAGTLASGGRLLQVKWYLAAAEMRLGHKAEALNEWRSICAANSVFGKEACGEIRRLKSADRH